jgi:hypothetical protein
VAVLGFPAGALAGLLAVTFALGLLVAGALAGRETALVAVMVVVEGSGGRGGSRSEQGQGGNERKERRVCPYQGKRCASAPFTDYFIIS